MLQSQAKFTVVDMLLQLPESHHHLAIQARFPTITREHHLQISPTSLAPPEHQERFLTRFFTATKVLTSLQSLHVDKCWAPNNQQSQMPDTICAAFDSMLQNLQHLTSLCLGQANTLAWPPIPSIQSECSEKAKGTQCCHCLLYTSPSPRD